MKIPLQNHSFSGRLIAVCGADGTGKTTLVRGMFKALKDQANDEDSIVCLKQPSGWWSGDPHVRSTILRKGSADIFDEFALGVFGAADRINQQAMVIQAALSSGKTVLLDRYVYCLIAYFIARKEPRIDYLVSTCTPLFEPDFTFVLHCPSEVAIKRVVERDGANPSMPDQQFGPANDFNEAYRMIARNNGLHVLSSLESMESLLKKALSIID